MTLQEIENALRDAYRKNDDPAFDKALADVLDELRRLRRGMAIIRHEIRRALGEEA